MELAAAGAPPPLAAANCGPLPTEVLHDILLRLPADEVCRLRLVCRSWQSLTSDPLFAAAHASRHPHVVFVVDSRHESSPDEAAEVRAVDLHGSVIKRRRIRLSMRALCRLSMHGDLVCASHGWGLARVVDVVTGAVVADVAADHTRKVNAAKPQCVLGHVPSTGEYKVLRIQVGRFSNQRPMCEVMTLGGGGGGRWRRLPRPPVSLNIELGGMTMAVLGGLAYFLVNPGPRKDGQTYVQAADSIAVFDLATEEWKPATLQGPLSSRGRKRKSTDDVDEEEADELMPVLSRKRFQLARLGDSLVMLYCNIEGCSTELWFMEDMEVDDMAARWTRRYTLQRTPFAEYEFFSYLRYHYPLAVLDDGRILVWVDQTLTLPSALRTYDPETSAWTDLATPTGGSVAGMHRGSLLCSNLGAA